MGLFTRKPKPKRGVCVYHLDIGQVAPDKVDEFISRAKKNVFEDQGLNEVLNAADLHFIVLPNRAQTTGLEVIDF